MMEVVAVGAHPDDIELGIGGTVATHVGNGAAVHFVVLTAGGAGNGNRSARKSEARSAAEFLGVDSIRFLDLDDTQVKFGHETIEPLERILDDVEPDRVYVHAEADSHQDHVNATRSVMAASYTCDQLLAYESPSTLSGFAPNYFVELNEETLATKLEAIDFHETQTTKDYTDTALLKGLARFRGSQTGTTYAEGFDVIRYVE